MGANPGNSDALPNPVLFINIDRWGDPETEKPLGFKKEPDPVAGVRLPNMCAKMVKTNFLHTLEIKV